MKKIYLQGYYGQNNLGDDYLFYSIIDQFGSSINDYYEINVDTENILFDEKQYLNLILNYNNVKLKVTFTNGKIGKIKRILSVIKLIIT